jgi:hypothetical protein
MVEIKSEEVNIYVEYLDNISLVNFIVTTQKHLLKDFQVEDELLSLTFENEKCLRIKFVEFKSIKTSAKATRRNVLTKEGCFESILRFQVVTNLDTTIEHECQVQTVKEINQLKCLSCLQNVVNTLSLTSNPE